MSDMISKLQDKARYIRSQILEMCCNAGTGHVTSSFSCTEILVALYYGDVLQFEPKEPKWPDRDRFILSKGQASAILYPILADLGYFPEEELEKFTLADGKFGVHLQHDVPGAEITSGSLGQGFGIATGIALAAKKNRDLYMTFSLLGDSECYEGAVWEAAMFAAHNRLNNLVAITDRNFMGVTNFTEEMLKLEPLEDKWISFGWNVKRIDGHSFEQLLDALKDVRSRKSDKPLMIIADTVKGKGVDFISYKPLWHAVTPKDNEILEAKRQIQTI